MFEDFDVRSLLMMVVPVLLGLTIHEYAHALAAHRLGDDTAKNEGRLTLNPLAHLDPLGTLMLFFSKLFGWAKPVPYNPRNFRNPVRDSTLVALAGPVSNFLTAVALAILFKVLVFFNFFSILPLGLAKDLVSIISLGILVNISLGVFNLMPIPPLDGFTVLAYFLPHRWVILAHQNTMVFLMIFIALMFFRIPQQVMSPIVYTLFQIVTG
jgi:Zn-dependent proteases